MENGAGAKGGRGSMKPSLQLGDGKRLAYSDAGTGRPLVLLHGWAMSGDLFVPQIEALAGRFRVVVPDLRGHGQSSRLDPADGLSQLADDLEALLYHLDLDDAILCGWSMGAMVAWDHLLRHRGGRIAGLVVIDMSPRVANDEHWTLGTLGGRDEADAVHMMADMRSDWYGFCSRFVPRIFAENADAALIGAALAAARANDPASMAQLWGSMIQQDFRASLPRIELPTLIVTGARSQLYSSGTGTWLQGASTRAQRAELAHSGHAPHLEEPARFNRLIQDFSEELAERVVPASCEPKST